MVEETPKEWVKDFSKCPQCGSENRMFEEMGKELIERGLAAADLKFYFEMKSNPLANQDIITKLPIGSKVPAFAVATDICVECGTIYAVRLERTNATKGLGLAPVQFTPNRSQRRAGMQGGFQFPPLT